jgi:hypothetical protein
MIAKLSELRRLAFKKLGFVLVFCGLLFGWTGELRAHSVPKRIAAVQKAFQRMPASTQEHILFRAQWGNWGNWGNWNNWANWTNWNNWSNWGNWHNV